MIVEEKASLAQLVGASMIKYDVLNTLISTAFAGSDATEIVLYIDIYSILKPVLGNNFYAGSHSELAALIMDLCVHYRQYFKKLGVKVNIVMVSSFNVPVKNKMIIPDYNYETVLKLTQESKYVVQNIQYLNTLCPYLEDIHFIYTEVETGVMIYHIASFYKPGIPIVILSRDAYNLQLVSQLPQSAYLRPKKVKGVDQSYIVFDQNTMWASLYEFMDANGEVPLIDPCRVQDVMALTKLPQRYIKSVFTIGRIVRFANAQIMDGIISPDQFTINYCRQFLCRDKKDRDLFESGLIQNRFNVIDILTQYMAFLQTPESKSIVLNNLYDPNGVKQVNNMYFKKNPIDLDRL